MYRITAGQCFAATGEVIEIDYGRGGHAASVDSARCEADSSRVARGTGDTQTIIVLVCAVVLLLGVLMAAMSFRSDDLGAAALPQAPREELFDGTRVWTVHLTFTAEQWDAMEPQGGAGPFGPPGGFGGGPPGGSAADHGGFGGGTDSGGGPLGGSAADHLADLADLCLLAA